MNERITQLDRQERTVASRLGAGQDIGRAYDRGRWAREAAPALGLPDAYARAWVDEIERDLRAAIQTLSRPGPRDRVAASRFVYAKWRDKFSHRAGLPGDQMLYLLYDKSDRLLYVGITNRGPSRLVEHYRKKPWFHEVCRVEFEWHTTREAVEDRERSLIHTRSPLHNIQHNRGRLVA